MTEILMLREPEIRSLLDPASCIRAVEDAFSAYATGGAELPSVIRLDIPERRGEIHVKAGYLHGGPVWAVKVASAFPENPKGGLPANDGLVLVFDATNGLPSALLFDNGFITDFRTAAAGAVAARLLARRNVAKVGVVGSGTQARLQVEMLAQVHQFGEVQVWGRRPEAAQRCVEDLSRRTLPEGCRVGAASSIEEAVGGAEVVFTVTASREPLVRSAWLAKGALVVAVGADQADKQELHPDVLARADRVVADSLAQCRAIGEIHHALAAGAITESKVTELGRITAGLEPARLRDDESLVCDLTGLGVQDVAAATLALGRARASGLGERFER